MINLPADQLNQAKTFIDAAQDILITIPSAGSQDTVSSGLALYLALSSQGKRVSIASPDQMTVEFNRLVGVDKISQTISGGNGKNLVISFPYQEGSIEKVSYNIENDIFNLVIEPREGYPMVTQDMMRYSNSGGNTDTIICIGASSLTDLNNLYNNNQGLFSGKNLINIDTNPLNQRFGKVNLVDPQSSSISEMIVSLFSTFGLSMDADIATNIYSGISAGSQNFTSTQTDAGTFEAVAICLRHGARKMSAPVPPMPPVASQPFEPFAKTQIPRQNSTQPQQQPKSQFQSRPLPSKPTPYQPQPRQTQQQFQQQRPQSPPQSQPQNPKQDEAPPDWLKPKIYKGSTLL